MKRVRITEFQPFANRVGKDTVIALTFDYDAELVEALKDGLEAVREWQGTRNPGGWLPDRRCWFVERSAWPVVQRFLRQGGAVFEVWRGNAA